MFRTKLDVDRHVQDVFRKLKDGSERNLRCYNIAKLYFQVGDHESAKRYVSSYLEVRTESAGAHKLLGQILEALGQKEDALSQYKISLELQSRQDDLVLKVCELLADMDVGVDVNRARYWVERADKQFPHHPVVFQLKEKLLTLDKPNNDGEDLKALIASELSVRPKDVQLRVKLLKHYMEKNKLDDAYKHAFEVEATQVHRDDVSWYQVLCDLLTKCKSLRKQDWSFWLFYISALERFVALTLKEQGNILKKSLTEATQALFNFDQSLCEAKSQNFSTNPTFMENMFKHMWGQLHFHTACLILRKTKREQGSWNEAGRLCAPLFLTALHVAPIDPTSPWAVHLKNESKNYVNLWYKEGSYRCSQAGHVLQDYARDEANRLMEKIDKFSTGVWRERIFQRIFISRLHSEIKTSYFASHKEPNPPLRLCSQIELRRYDEISEEVWPASLHHQIWLGITNRFRSSTKKSVPFPQHTCHLFPELQFATYNLSQCAPESLSRLDIEAFLNAAVLCTYISNEEQQRSSFLNPERLPTLPSDLTNTLCSSVQEKWWSYAYKMYRRHDVTMNDMGEIRQELQRGLEVVRCIGNHGLHPSILVHLARIFHYRMKELGEKNPEHSDIPALEARCELYWSTAIPLLERLQNNQAIRTTSSKLFDYQGKEMNNLELSKAMEEGRLLLVQKHVRNKEYERAIDALQLLKCPEASFEQGKIYKKIADDLVKCLPKESLTSETRSQHVIILTKARSCFYLTLDRLRSPEVDSKHPLNSELVTYIADIENELKRIDPDLWRNGVNRNDCDGLSEESYSSAHSNEEIPVINNTIGMENTVQFFQTPQRNTHRTPKQASTPCRIQHQDILELSRSRVEARPSPERLDAQIRQLMHFKDNIVQTVMDQNKALMESNRAMMEKLEDLRKEVAELRIETQKQKPAPATNHSLEEDLYFLGEEDYSEYQNYQNPPLQQPQTTPIPLGVAQAQRHPYSNLVYPPATLQGQPIGYYQGGLPFTDPNHHLSSLYAAAAAAANVYPVPSVAQMYPRLPVDQIPKIPDNILQQALFSQVPPAMLNQPIQPIQVPIVPKIDPPKADPPKEAPIIKSVPVSKPAPVNVVITSSDTLPTSVSTTVQPIMSVTIPPQHRLGSTSTSSYEPAPHSYQISMPSQATIPTTVILPPLQSTLTVSSPMNKSADKINTSVHSTGSHNNSVDYNEVEHDPIPDFVPIIPLPEEVAVTTGEENEVTLFSARAKLFRFAEKEWKERGVGKVKLLRNQEGKVRLLMRRDQVFKICANHMLSKDMELSPMPSNSKALMWVANDFADEEVRLEKLCIRFKTEEEALAFKESFDKAKLSLPDSPEKPKKESKKVESKKDTKPETVKETKTDSPVIKLGGFSFTSQPVLQKGVAEEEHKKAIQKEEPPKVSPFAQFSFGKADSSTLKGFGSPSAASQIISGISFVKAAENQNESPQSANIFGENKNMKYPSGNVAATNENAKDIEDAEIAEGEMSVFSHKANLMHLNNDTNTWMDKGSGQVNVLFNIKTTKMRFLMLNANSTKVCCNQPILADMKFSFRATSDTVITWVIPNVKTKKSDSYAVTFKSHKVAQQFLETVQSNQQKLDKTKSSNKTKDSLSTLFKPASGSWECTTCYIRNDAEKTKCVACDTPLVSDKSSSKTKESLSTLFKPATGSWECTSCYIRNDAEKTICVACNTPADAKKVETKSAAFVSKNQNVSGQKPLSELFKPTAGSWTCQGCYMVNESSTFKCPACETPKDSSAPTKSSDMKKVETKSTAFVSQNQNVSGQKPLSELFKPSAGSWTCQGCYMVNESSILYCPACESPKDSSVPPKPKSSIFGTSTDSSTKSTFTFGVPQANKEASSGGFSFSALNANKTKGSGDADNSNASSVFGGAKKTDPVKTNFTFGVPQRPVTPPSTEKAYVFGSPGKSFDFQFSSKTPVKSPGGGETSEDEVVESDDIYFAPVIPLPDKIDVKTGEEDEEVLYSHRAKLFRFDSGSKEWKERGLGDIKLLKHRRTHKLRLVMRRDQILKLCLNHAATADLEISARDDKTWMWSAADYSEGEIEYSQFACRFKTPEIAKEFKSAIDSAFTGQSPSKELSKLQLNDKVSTPAKKESKDIEIIYEATVTPQEKELARKLLLPENFYSYKDKEDCPGCIGCKEPGIPLFDKKPVASVAKALDFSNSSSPVNQKLAEKLEAPKTSTTTPTPAPQSIFSFSRSTNKPNFFGTDLSSTSNKSETPSNEKPTPNFTFGGTLTQPTTEQKDDTSAIKTTALSLESQKICSPSIKLPTSAVATAFNFSDASKTSNIFGTKPFMGQEKSIFNVAPSSNTGSIFGGSAFNSSQKDTATPTANPEESTQNNKQPSIFSGFSQNTATTTGSVFGSQVSSLSFSTMQNSPTTVAAPTPGFGSTPVFGNFGGGMTNNIFDKPADSNTGAKKTVEVPEKITFLPTDNSISFSTLAAQSDQNAFKKDPNFAFEGAGSSVFGAKFKSPNNTLNNSKKSLNASKQEEVDNEEEGEENDEEHDPHFEPIIPLPDAIEVRTGEEDEEKIFCQRGKLYRYNSNTKEWKERGVGDVKILHHVEGGTYRILLRREQVHKVVCNMLLTADLDFKPLQTSDRAWIWAGMNYYEGEANLEELAVRFKNPELALQFKAAIDKAQLALQEKPSIKQAIENVNDTTVEEKYDVDEDDEDYGDEGEDEEDFDGEEVEEEEEEQSIMFEKRATLYTQNEEQTWTNLGMGCLKIFYDSDIFGARIIMEADDIGEIISNTIISIDTTMQIIGKECMWKAYDYALNPPERRLLKASFSSTQSAEEMLMNFEDGQDYAKGAEIRDQPEIYIPDEE